MSMSPDLLVVSTFGSQCRACCAYTEIKSSNVAAFSLSFYSIARSLRSVHSFVVVCKNDPENVKDCCNKVANF